MIAHRQQIKGFTLIEILIAVAVFAIFSAMAYGSLTRLLDNRERIEAERDFWREVSLGFIRMQQDFSLVRKRPIRDNDGEEKAAFIGQPTDTRALGDPNVEFTRGGVLIPNGFTADVQRIGYRLVDGNIARITWPVLDRAPMTKPAITPFFRDVEEFQVRFYQDSQTQGGTGSPQGGTWIDRWPPLLQTSNVGPLPRAVEVTVAFKNRGKYKRIFLVGNDK